MILLNFFRKVVKRINCVVSKEEIDKCFDRVNLLKTLNSPYIAKYYEGFSETSYGPYYIVSAHYPVRRFF